MPFRLFTRQSILAHLNRSCSLIKHVTQMKIFPGVSLLKRLETNFKYLLRRFCLYIYIFFFYYDNGIYKFNSPDDPQKKVHIEITKTDAFNLSDQFNVEERVLLFSRTR